MKRTIRRLLRPLARPLARLRWPPRRPQPELSILVASIPTRIERFLGPLLAALDAQIPDPARVEVLTLVDNRSMSIGEKRNRLRAIAAGRYSAFVDDDDRVAVDYVDSILAAIRERPGRDVYCFDVWVRGYDRLGIGGPEGMVCHYGLELEHANLPDHFTRKPNHLMVYRTALARRVRFPDTSHGEDDTWGAAVARLARSEFRIGRVLYHYDYSLDTSETPWSRMIRDHRARRAR